jgi:hypothetical protein
MEFLYPVPVLNSHLIKGNPPNSLEYPKDSSFNKKINFENLDGVPVCIIRENVGYNQNWAEVLVVNYQYSEYAFFKNKFYIEQSYLQNIKNRERYQPLKTPEFNIDINAIESDPALKQIFIPYVDRKNGLYSVRIQTDYDKVLESFVFAKLLEDVYLEGIKILLSSRGLRSDNETINKLRNKYYTFGFVNKDLDLTTTRQCEPLTFTVSIPLNFFDIEAPYIKENKSETILDIIPDTTIRFSNKDLLLKINLIANAFANRENNLARLLYPNKSYRGFVLSIEIASLKTFYSSASELFSGIGYSFSDLGFIEYEIGLNSNFELVKIKIIKNNKEYVLPTAALSQFRMSGEFNSKRIFSYFQNYDSLISEGTNTDVIEFISRYVKFPVPSIEHKEITINGMTIPDEVADRYRVEFDQSAESCLRLSDITGLTSNIINFTDVAFNLFVKEQDEEGKVKPSNIEKIGAAFKNIKEEISAARAADSKSDSAGVVMEVGPAFAEAGKEYVEKYSDYHNILSTLGYYCQRINFTQVIFSKMICLLKRIDPNDPDNPELARVVSEIPLDLINFANSLQGVNRLTGANFARAINNGVNNFDMNLFCGTNMETIYFIRGMTKMLKVLNIAGTQAISFANSLADRDSPENPWKGFATTMIKSFERAMIDIIFAFLKNLLSDNCDDDPRDSNGNDYRNPFETHNPIDRFNNTKENSNSSVLNANRLKILDSVFPPDGQYRRVVYGTDRNYEVSVLGQLLTDINCVLTPQESINLLLGKPSEQVEVLIKNLVAKKYSTPPNDLRYITRDMNYMKAFFKRLGLTVDQEFLIMKDPSKNSSPLTLATLCRKTTTEEEDKFRKVPIGLPVLQDRNRALTKRVSEMLELIKDGKLVNASAICSDEPDSTLSEAKETLLETYREGIISEFEPVLTAFNDEVLKLPETYAETRNYFRRDSDGKLIDTIDYHAYNDNLSRNLEDARVENSRVYCLPKYMTAQGTEEIAKQNLILQESEISLICPDNQFTLSSDFEKILDNGQLVVEFADGYLFDAEDGDLNDMYSESENRRVSRYLKDKKIVYAISLNKDILQNIVTLGISDDADEIEFKIIYNDSTNGKFRILNKVHFEKDKKDIIGNPNYSSTAFYNNLDINIFNGGTKKNELDDSNDVYYVTKEVFNNLGIEEKNLIQAIWVQKFSKDLEKIKAYEKQIALINQFNDIGIFNIQKNNTTAKINVSTMKQGTEENTMSIEETTFLEYECGEFNLFDVKKYFNIIRSTMHDRKYLKHGFNKLTDLKYYDNSEGFLGIGAGNAEEVFPENTSEANEFIEDKDYAIHENIENDQFFKQITKLRLFDYVQTPEQEACGIVPHYLNLEYFLNFSIDVGRKELCDDTLDMIPVDITDDVLVNLITRAHVTDLLIKCLPVLSTQTENYLFDLYKQDRFIDFIIKMIKAEMSVYSPDKEKNSYNRLFLERVEKVYTKQKNDNNLNKKLIEISRTAFEYYVRREIRYFIRSCIDRGMFTPSESDLNDNFKKNGIDGSENLNNLYFLTIVYFMANNTVDYTKRIQFSKTLKSLSRIFFSNSGNSSITQEEQESFAGSNKSQQEVVKFIQDLGYSSNPAVFGMLKPQYGKYVKYFLEEAARQGRNTLLRIAQNGDRNISLTRKINFAASTAAMISWVLVPDEDKQNLIYNSSNELEALFWKRIDSGRSPIPDVATSGLLMLGSIFPGPYGIAYLLNDTLLEAAWTNTALYQLRQAKGLKAKDDPCAPKNSGTQDKKQDITCSIDKKKELISKLNEEELSNTEENL